MKKGIQLSGVGSITPVLAPSVAGAGQATEIKVLASNAVKNAFENLIPAFEKASGRKVTAIFASSTEIFNRISGGESVDLVIATASVTDALIKQGKLIAGSKVNFSKSGIGVAIRPGVPKPDISSGDTLKASLLTAKSIILSTGPSSGYLIDLFQRMGIADALKPKLKQLALGMPVGPALANGEGDLGFTQICEFLPVKGIEYIGPLSADIQHITLFSMGLHASATAADAARSLMRFLASPTAISAIRSSGMEPA
jgi:molybdate transport system substrate-binding protein